MVNKNKIIEINELVNKLNTDNKDIAFGKLLANFFISLNDLNEKNIELLEVLKKSSDDTTNVYKKIMWLTFVLSIAAFKEIYDIIILIFQIK